MFLFLVLFHFRSIFFSGRGDKNKNKETQYPFPHFRSIIFSERGDKKNKIRNQVLRLPIFSPYFLNCRAILSKVQLFSSILCSQNEGEDPGIAAATVEGLAFSNRAGFIPVLFMLKSRHEIAA